MLEILNDLVFVLVIFVLLVFRPLKDWFKRKKFEWKLKKKADKSVSKLKQNVSFEKDKDKYGSDLTKRLVKRLSRSGAYTQTVNEEPYTIKFNNKGYLVLVRGLNFEMNSTKEIDHIYGGQYVIDNNLIHMNIHLFDNKDSLYHRKTVYSLRGYCEHVDLKLTGYSYMGIASKHIVNMNFKYLSRNKVGKQINSFLLEKIGYIEQEIM